MCSAFCCLPLSVSSSCIFLVCTCSSTSLFDESESSVSVSTGVLSNLMLCMFDVLLGVMFMSWLMLCDTIVQLALCNCSLLSSCCSPSLCRVSFFCFTFFFAIVTLSNYPIRFLVAGSGADLAMTKCSFCAFTQVSSTKILSLVDILVDALSVSWKMLFDILAQWVFVICPVFCFLLDVMCFSCCFPLRPCTLYNSSCFATTSLCSVSFMMCNCNSEACSLAICATRSASCKLSCPNYTDFLVNF